MASKTTEGSKYANRTTFRKGDGRVRKTVGSDARMSRECKEMIANCFEKMGGLAGLVAWERKDAFYTRLYPRPDVG